MRIASVICEFNPFHNGHKYIVDTIKKDHADCVVAIMSGNFVQRGDVAITDKFERTKAALQSGCDIVVELPCIFALSSAERFAKSGVQLANALNSDLLCFGAENADIDKLKEISKVLQSDPFNIKLKEHLSTGEYYPKAVSNTVSELLPKEDAEILSGANNTLAIEYIKALKNTSISPVAISRTGTDHDSNITTGNIASATHIRNLIRENKSYDNFTPMDITNTYDIRNLETAILYKLRTMDKSLIENLPDVCEGLHNRIYDCAKKSNSLEELLLNLKTKRFTLARLRRIIMCALLDITKGISNTDVEYVRVLGMNSTGAQLLSECKLPLLCRYPDDYNKLSDIGKKQFDIEIKATNVFSLSSNTDSKSINELKSQIIRFQT